MYYVEVECDHCHKPFSRRSGQYTEAINFDWKQFCSKTCLSKNRMRRVSATCTNPSCRVTVSRQLNQAKKSKLIFCSISCSAEYYNAIRKSYSLLRKCNYVNCNNYIKTSDSRRSYCSRICATSQNKGSTKYTKKKILKNIRGFEKEHGRIPIKNELGYLNRQARRMFGTWNKMIIAAGFEPNPVMFAKQCKALDGHRCDSVAEMIVDDWLYRREIEHQVNIRYPWNNGMTADFVVEETWIEIFGLAGEHKRYDELKKRKLELAKEYQIEILQLTLKDVYRNGIERKLAKLA